MFIVTYADNGLRRTSAKLLPTRLLLALAILLTGSIGHAQGEPSSGDGQQADSQQTPKYVTGKELTSEEERAVMRERMHSAATPRKHQGQGRTGPHAGQHKPNTGQLRSAVTEADISEPQSWGAAENVVKVKHLYFSAQPDAAGINAAKDAGVEVVINLRSSKEMDWDEAGAVTQAGLTYYQVPISGEGPAFDRDSMQRISALVKKHHKQPVWLHCSSGNRASAWLAVHLAQDHSMDIDQSIELARKAGLTNAELETRVRTYVSSTSGD